MNSSGLSDFPPRRYTKSPLPAYRHVPGYSPHPINDVAGHSYRAVDELEEPRCMLSGVAWQSCEPYLYGVDLFNLEFFWEAHENWEPLWHAAGHRSGPGLFIQGLIQVAAAFLLARADRPRAVPRMLERAERNLHRAVAENPAAFTAGEDPFGIALSPWLISARLYLNAALVGEHNQRFPFIELSL
ncbi:MAG: hypothetical protein CSA65_09110 [Proteobacteria bacterium]|nr:MAG: hypothetical protein CSA65_09110 [Pseudomonadota bacterium]